MNDYIIWWLTQPEAELAVLPKDAPIYLSSELRARIGRVGRGRLWASTEFEPTEGVDAITAKAFKEVQTPLTTFLGTYAGGIVLRRSDFSWVANQPGLVTTLDLRRWWAS